MILILYIAVVVLAFLFMSAGLYFGVNRRNIIGGKGVSVLCFMLASILFVVTAMNSLNIEITHCLQPQSTVFSNITLNSTTIYDWSNINASGGGGNGTGEPQTPWASDIYGASYSLSGPLSIIINGTVKPVASFNLTDAIDPIGYTPSDSPINYYIYAYKVKDGVRLFSTPLFFSTPVTYVHTKFTISWPSVSGADGYMVERWFPSDHSFYDVGASTSIVDQGYSWVLLTVPLYHNSLSVGEYVLRAGDNDLSLYSKSADEDVLSSHYDGTSFSTTINGKLSVGLYNVINDPTTGSSCFGINTPSYGAVCLADQGINQLHAWRMNTVRAARFEDDPSNPSQSRILDLLGDHGILYAYDPNTGLDVKIVSGALNEGISTSGDINVGGTTHTQGLTSDSTTTFNWGYNSYGESDTWGASVISKNLYSGYEARLNPDGTVSAQDGGIPANFHSQGIEYNGKYTITWDSSGAASFPYGISGLTGSTTAILKGDGSGGIADAVPSTDFAPPTSGTDILKGNGAGGFSAAAAGTDYLAPSGDGTSLTGVLHPNSVSGTFDTAINTQLYYTDGQITGQATAFDSRLMKDITNQSGVDCLQQLCQVLFNWTSVGLKQFKNQTEWNHTISGRYVAQDVQRWYPQCTLNVTENLTGNKTVYLTYNKDCVSGEVLKVKDALIAGLQAKLQLYNQTGTSITFGDTSVEAGDFVVHTNTVPVNYSVNSTWLSALHKVSYYQNATGSFNDSKHWASGANNGISPAKWASGLEDALTQERDWHRCDSSCFANNVGNAQKQAACLANCSNTYGG